MSTDITADGHRCHCEGVKRPKQSQRFLAEFILNGWLKLFASSARLRSLDASRSRVTVSEGFRTASVLICGLCLSVLICSYSLAQEMAVPVNVQVPLFLKILTFDWNLKARVGNEIVVGIVYQSKFRASLNVKDKMMNQATEYAIKKIENIPIRYISVDLDEVNLVDAISSNKIDIIYVAPVRALGMGIITDLSRTQKILTLTGVPDYVESGISVGIGIRGEKPLIIINLPAAKAEGVDFSSQLLKLAKVIK